MSAGFPGMGEYGWFVWPSYVLVLGALITLVVVVARGHAKWKARVAALEAEQAARRERAA
jgi:heme exporter protein CcmD